MALLLLEATNMDNPYRTVIEWLESADGECWSRQAHNVTGPATRLITIKDDNAFCHLEVPLWVYVPDSKRVRSDFECAW